MPKTAAPKTARPARPARVGPELTPQYAELAAAFPLTKIADEAHLDAATAVMGGLLRRRLDAGGEAYLDALSDLVIVYEGRHHPIPDLTPAEMLAVLLEERGMTQAALVRATGIARSTVSAIAAGKRGPTPGQMAALGQALNVPPAVFLPAAGGG